MDLLQIEKRVKIIEQSKNEEEIAHGMEDALYRAFICHIAKKGNSEQIEMAKAILKTKQIKFSRYCA